MCITLMLLILQSSEGTVKKTLMAASRQDYCISFSGYNASAVPFSNVPFTLHYLLHYGTVAFLLMYHHVPLNFIHTLNYGVTQQPASLGMLPLCMQMCTSVFPTVPP